jgi:DNA-binding beta-propeller fold protein YncE
VDRETVRLAWQPVRGAQGYRVYHGAPEQYRYEPAGESVRGTAWTGTLGSGALHRYVVTAVGADGKESAFSPAAGAMHFLQPWGIVVRPDGKRLIRDRGYGQAVLQKPDGNTVGLVGSVHYHFEGSYDLALDSKGRVLSAKLGDGYNPQQGFKVQNADLKETLVYLRAPGKEPGQVDGPMGIAADSRDHVFLADTGNDRVQEFGPDGKFLRVHGAGELRRPMKVAFDRQDRMFVADSAKDRIAVFARGADGEYRLERSLDGVKKPVYVLTDERGRVYASPEEGPVQVFDASGKPSGTLAGTRDAPITAPRGLALDGKGNLLVVDSASRRVIAVRLP